MKLETGARRVCAETGCKVGESCVEPRDTAINTPKREHNNSVSGPSLQGFFPVFIFCFVFFQLALSMYYSWNTFILRNIKKHTHQHSQYSVFICFTYPASSYQESEVIQYLFFFFCPVLSCFLSHQVFYMWSKLHTLDWNEVILSVGQAIKHYLHTRMYNIYSILNKIHWNQNE